MNFSIDVENGDSAQVIVDEASTHLIGANRADMELIVAEDFMEYQILKKKI